MPTRRTAIPGTWVEQIEIKSAPFDEPGVIQEFVGQGLLRDIDPLQSAADFSSDTVGDFIRTAEDMIGPLMDTYKIRYHLLMRVTPIPEKLQERSVTIRARMFARLKNPFEPDLIEVESARKDRKLSDDKVGDIYKVVVTVTK